MKEVGHTKDRYCVVATKRSFLQKQKPVKQKVKYWLQGRRSGLKGKEQKYKDRWQWPCNSLNILVAETLTLRNGNITDTTLHILPQ